VVAPPKHDAPPATATQFGQLFEDAERALEAIDFFKTRYPEHVMRTAKSLAYRAEPTAREIELIRAMAIEVLRTLERARIISPNR
jgi:tRNA C32,U32 (ribose-2'-O)-methylase TrmJ